MPDNHIDIRYSFTQQHVRSPKVRNPHEFPGVGPRPSYTKIQQTFCSQRQLWRNARFCLISLKPTEFLAVKIICMVQPGIWVYSISKIEGGGAVEPSEQMSELCSTSTLQLHVGVFAFSLDQCDFGIWFHSNYRGRTLLSFQNLHFLYDVRFEPTFKTVGTTCEVSLTVRAGPILINEQLSAMQELLCYHW